MNCIENLPVYAAIVVAIMASGVASPWLDGLAIGLGQTEAVAAIRFALYFVQIGILFAMGIFVAVQA